MARTKTTKEEIEELFPLVVIEVLTMVEDRYKEKEKCAEIKKALTRLKNNIHDKEALEAASAYCSDRWVVGPIN